MTTTARLEMPPARPAALAKQQPIEFANNPDAGDRGVSDQRQALARAVVDHHQNAHSGGHR